MCSICFGLGENPQRSDSCERMQKALIKDQTSVRSGMLSSDGAVHFALADKSRNNKTSAQHAGLQISAKTGC